MDSEEALNTNIVLLGEQTGDLLCLSDSQHE